MVRKHNLFFRISLLLLLWGVFFPLSTEAYVPRVVEQSSLYDIYTITEPTREQYFYGRLDNFPHTYEVTITESTPLFVEVLVPVMEGVKEEVNGIIVKREGRQGRVIEIARMLARDATWEEFRENWGGDYYRRGSLFEEVVDPGTYRIEVSTPNNDSPYVLVIGTDTGRGDVSYFEMLGRIGDVKAFYGASRFMVIVSPYIYVPLLLLSMGIGLLYWYRRRNRPRVA